jgi:Zn-dependent protease with chaperone function
MATMTKAALYAPPSALLRAALSLLLLLVFYAVLLGTAAALFAAPVAALLTIGLRFYVLFMFAVCWIPAALLVMSAFTTRRPEFVPPSRQLKRDEAPALFAMVEELAAQAGTEAPTELYLDWLPNLAVTETGGVLRSRRVLIIGVPLVAILSVEELRAGLAHELGHFVGGDTRLMTFSLQTHALFTSVISAVERNPFSVGAHHYAIEGGLAFAQALGHGIVMGYSRFYLRLTRPLSRRQELAADALSAQLVSAAIAARTLEKVAIAAPLYFNYLQEEVGFAMKRGVMPTDLTAGFARMKERFLAADSGQRFVEAVRIRPTSPYDTHPALAERLQALAPRSEGAANRDDRAASALLADARACDDWLLQTTRERMIAAIIASDSNITTLRELPWARIPDEVYAPAALEAARRAAERLHPLFPGATTLGGMFAAAWQRIDAGGAIDIVRRLDPALARMPPHDAPARAAKICREVLGTLLQGALLERGAVAEDSFGEATLILRLGEERINAIEALMLLATDAAAGRALFDGWAQRLGAPTA